jgi:hypothetical protein
VACHADNTQLYVYEEDGDARRYQMQQIEIGPRPWRPHPVC